MLRIQNLQRTTRKILNRLFEWIEEGIERLGAAGDALTSAPPREVARRAVGEGTVRRSPEVPPTAASEPRPEGPMVARVAGERAVFEAPIPLAEDHLQAPKEAGVGPFPPLPDAYADDSFRALARDPFTLWVYWDFAPDTVRDALRGLRSPRAKLRIYRGGEIVRDLDFALESRSYYVNELEPGGTYQAEIVFVGENGERRVGRRSNAVMLPPFGPSSLVDDRVAWLPWEARLGRGVDLSRESIAAPGGTELRASRWQRGRGGASDRWVEGARRPPDVGSDRRFGRTSDHRGEG